MNQPRVSIIVPTYNRAAYLPRALDSVEAQTFKDWELLLVDDGSTDATAQVIEPYAKRWGDRFVYLKQEKNRGASGARNIGIDHSRGRYIAFLDSDDEFRPRKLERQLSLFKRCPTLGFVYSDYSYVEVDGTFCISAFDQKHPIARSVPCTRVGDHLFRCKGRLFDVLIKGYFLCSINGLIKREILSDDIRFPTGQTFGEEWLFHLRLVQACEAGFVDEPLSIYHHHKGSLARTDHHRNVENYRHLLVSIRQEFGKLSRSNNRVTRGHLVLLERQLGCEAYKRQRYGEAMRHFVASFKWRPSVRGLVYTTQAAMRAVLTGHRVKELGAKPREETKVG